MASKEFQDDFTLEDLESQRQEAMGKENETFPELEGEVEEKERVVDEAKVSVISQAINDFFEGKPRNHKRVEWVNPKKVLLPEELCRIYDSMHTFFKRKNWYSGGPIPNELLYTKPNFHLINNISLYDAVDLVYDSIAVRQTLARTVYKKDVEIVITIRVIHECESLGVPQEYIGGLLVLYFVLCENVVAL